MVCPWRKNQHLCIRIYHQQTACALWRRTLFLNLRTILLYTLTMMTVLLQTVKKNSHQLQEMQTTCKAQTPPITRPQKTNSMTSSGISNFQKIRQNFWHQIYNSGIYYATPFCSKFECFSWKFKSCKFHRTCTRSDGFVGTAGVQYVAENALFVFHTWISFH